MKTKILFRLLLLVQLIVVALTAMAHAQIDVSAHRGNHDYRENTLSALLSALDSEASSIEFDVHLTSDSHLVLYHDADLNPLDFEGLTEFLRIHDHTLQEIQSFPFKAGKRLRDGETRVPSLRELFKALQARALTGAPAKILHLEVKSDTGIPSASATPAAFVRELLRVIDGLPVADEIVVRSFDARILKHLKRVRPSLKRVLLVDRNQLAGLDIKRVTKELGIALIAPHHLDVSREFVARWAEEGVGVSPWTVNEPGRALELAAMGIEGFATDLAHEFAGHLKGQGLRVGSGFQAPLCSEIFKVPKK